MKGLLRFWALLLIAARRLRSQTGLTAATALGMMILAALVMSIPAYADAVSYRILSTRLQANRPFGGTPAQDDPSTSRPPFVYEFHYSGPYRGAYQWEHARPVDAYLTGPASADLGLPLVW